MTRWKNIRFFNNKVSFLLDLKALSILTILLMGMVVLFIISTGMGEMKIGPLKVVQALFGQGSDMDILIIQTFRLPRILVAMMVGMALAAAGAILQGMVRNPLASPDILGITGGAGAAVTAFLAIFSDANNALTVSIHYLPAAAFLGAVVSAFLVYVLAWKDGASPIRLVLIGIGIMAFMKALTTLMMMMGPIYQASQANIWITGTVYGSNWKHVEVLVPVTLLLLIISFISARTLNLQELGDDISAGAGAKVQMQRMFLLLISTGLIGSAVAFGGGIGFVGLMAPHIARKLVGSDYGSLLPAAALIGGILVMFADLIGRTLFSPLEIPAGVFTAGIGTPYFIYLLIKTRNI